MKTLDQLPPLPKSVSHAVYIDGVREVVQYVIDRDEFIVRYDWIKDGKQVAYFATPISPIEDFSKAIKIRRREVGKLK